MTLLSPLAALYGAGTRLRNTFYDRGTIQTRRLGWPVISIGNLRAGGTGKTPFTISLGKLLQERGIAFDVLSRGYRRDDVRTIKLVDPQGSAREFGDEPLLISQKLGVPVIVGADRFAAGLAAEKMFSELKPSHGGKWFHLLDDGFQHRRLHRDFDIVLLSDSDAEDTLLPAGRLREPLSALRRAHAVVLMDGASAGSSQLDGKLIWHAHRKVSVNDVPSSPVAFCGVARPGRFFADLAACGLQPVAEKAFPDHHRYSEHDVQRLIELFRQRSANGFITTEKDLINLRRLPSAALKSLQPLKVLSLECTLEKPGEAVDAILNACALTSQAETIKRP